MVMSVPSVGMAEYACYGLQAIYLLAFQHLERLFSQVAHGYFRDCPLGAAGLPVSLLGCKALPVSLSLPRARPPWGQFNALDTIGECLLVPYLPLGTPFKITCPRWWRSM